MRRLALALLLPLAVAACAGIDAYHGERSLNRREIAPGPGLFTGEAGKWTILRPDLPSADRDAPTDDHTSSEGTTTP
jgi:hypothetical protein